MPFTSGFAGSLRSIVKSGSVCRNVTMYPRSPTKRTE
jgi:hypothetical protein